MIDPETIYATSSPSEAIDVPGAPTGTPSSIESPGTTASSRLPEQLRDESWVPATGEEAIAAINEIGHYCRDYCPVVKACGEESCRLYRLESRSLEALGLRQNPVTEAVGVIGQPITGLG